LVERNDTSMSGRLAGTPLDFQPGEDYAQDLDARDPLASFRSRFHHPRGPGGKPLIYFTGNSLGLQPRSALALVHSEMKDWADLALGGHFRVSNWCSYKYLNGGPGAVGGCFVHETHGRDLSLPRLAGWWGNDPATRFRMDPEFVPRAGADGWQVSNPPILAMAPLKAALAIFDEAGPEALRRKSMVLTGYLEYLVDRLEPRLYEVITPRDPPARGCQLSLRAGGKAREIQKALEKKGVITDFREPDVIRVAPVPLYNQFHEVWRFSRILGESAASSLFRD